MRSRAVTEIPFLVEEDLEGGLLPAE